MATVLNKVLTTKGKGISQQSMMVGNSLGNKVFLTAKNRYTLIDVTGHLPSNICGVSGADKAFSDDKFYMKLADSMQRDINATGGNLKEDYYKGNTVFLNTYFLLLGLSYVLIESKDGQSSECFLATKNDVVLKFILKCFDIKGVSDEKIKKLGDKRIITDNELNEKYFSVIKFSYNVEKCTWKVGTSRIYPNSSKTYVMPYIPTKLRAISIIEFLRTHPCRIEYGQDKIMYSTLNNAKDYTEAIRLFDTDLCALRLFDYTEQNIKVLNTLDIHCISAVQKRGY